MARSKAGVPPVGVRFATAATDREDYEIDGPDVGRRGARRHGGQEDVTEVALNSQAGLAHRLQMRAASYEADVAPCLDQPGADIAATAARSHHGDRTRLLPSAR